MRLDVLNPSGAVEVSDLYARRLGNLDGKTICELSNGGWEYERTFPRIRELLLKRFPNVKFVPYTNLPLGISEINVANMGEIISKIGCDAVIGGNAG
jgi:hypothetical protein